MEWYLVPWKKYAVCSGRARRKEYWTFAAINWVAQEIFKALIGATPLNSFSGDFDFSTGMIIGLVLLLIFNLVLLIPSFTVTVRRLHDTNRSGWAILILLIPIVGLILFIVWLCKDSDLGENDYGPDPKAIIVDKPCGTDNYEEPFSADNFD